MAIKLALIIVFFVVTIFIGVMTRKHSKSVAGFVLGGRTVGPWLSAFSYGTSYFSAVVFVGYAGQFGWKYGMAAVWIGIGNALVGSLLAWVVLARRARTMSHALDSSTMPDFFGKRFGSTPLKVFASAIVFVFLIPYTASIYKGLSTLFGMAFDVPYWVCVLVMAGITAIYVILGGYMATAVNDFVQGIIMLVGIVAVIWFVMNEQGGFFSAITTLSQVPADSGAVIPANGVFTSMLGPDPVNLVGVIILTSVGTWGLPQMVTKFYAIKDEKSIKIGTTISTVFAVIIAGGCYLLGGFGRLFDSEFIHGSNGSIIFDNIMPLMMSKLPDVLLGVVVVLVLSASMSTLSALVLSSSSTLTLDLIGGVIKKNMTDKTKVFVMRILVVVFILLSVVLALNPPTFIAQLMGVSWGALAGSFLAPFLFSLYSKRSSKVGVWACFIFGVGFTLANMVFHFFASPINAGAFTMVASFAIMPLFGLLGKPADKDQTDKLFEEFKEKA
ncbi:MAG: sodium/solute symporter [Oscillospiraceae bacterium]|jgi:SSS family solute:Na+ symporter|nr:sodium/solute symporter [Oscillospiraceae bacterium]